MNPPGHAAAGKEEGRTVSNAVNASALRSHSVAFAPQRQEFLKKKVELETILSNSSMS